MFGLLSSSSKQEKKRSRKKERTGIPYRVAGSGYMRVKVSDILEYADEQIEASKKVKIKKA